MEPLTPRQQDILHHISDVIASRGTAPTFREIADAFGISVSSVQEHLAALKRKQYLDVIPRVRRGIRLTRGRREWRVERTSRGEFEKRFGERLRRETDLQGLFTLVREEFPAWLGVGRAGLFVRDAARRAWRGEAFFERRPGEATTAAQAEVRDPLLDAVLRRRRPAAEGTAAAVPVLARDRVLGALRLEDARNAGPSTGSGQAGPGEAAVTRAAMAAAALAAILERASLDAELRRGIRLQAALVALCRTLNSAGDLGRVLSDIYEIVAGLVPAEYFHIGAKDEDGQWWILLERDLVDGKPWEYPGFQRAEMHTSEAKRAIQTQPFYIRHRTPEEIRVLEGKGPEHIDPSSGGTSGDVSKRGRSLLYVPLRTGGEIVGYFTAQSYSYNAYSIRNAEDLILVGEYIGLAVQNAWRREKERAGLERVRSILAAFDGREGELKRAAARAGGAVRAPLESLARFIEERKEGARH